MSGAQKVSISLLISVLVFSVLAVLVAVDRFRVLETAFYVPRVEESIRERAEQTADVSDAFHSRNLSRYGEFVLEDAVRAAFRINASAAQIQERRDRLDALEAEQASLDRIRIIDLDASQIHYSSDPTDYVDGATQRTYLRPDEVSADEGVTLSELAFFEEIADDFELPTESEIPEVRIFLNPRANQFIYRIPILDTSGILQGAALFYVNVLDLSTSLIRNGLIGTGDQVRVVNESGIAVRVPAQVAETLVNTVDAQWSSIAASDERVSLVSDAVEGNEASDAENRSDVDAAGQRSDLRYEAFSVEPSLNGTLVYLEPSTSLEMPLPLQYTLIGAVFLTTFLIAFLVLNIRQDAVVVLRDRVKRFQVNLLREYMEAKEEIDFERWRAELEDRREEVSKQVRRGLGRLKPDEKKEVDELIDRSWDEIIDVLSSRAQSKPIHGGDIGRIEEIVDQLTRRLATTPLNVQTTQPVDTAPAPEALSGSPSGEPAEVEEVEELGDAEEPEELGELEDADEPEELGVLEDADEPEEVGELEDADEPEELGELEDADEPEELGELEDAEDADEPEEVGELEDADEPEELGELEDAEDADEPEEVGELEDADEPEELGELEDADEPEELGELEDADEPQELGELEDADEPEELGELEDVDDVEEVAALEAENGGRDVAEVEPSDEVDEPDEVGELEVASDEFEDSDERDAVLEGEAEREPVRFPAGFKPESVTFETLNEQAELEWLAAKETDNDELAYSSVPRVEKATTPELQLVRDDEIAGNGEDARRGDSSAVVPSGDSSGNAEDEVEELEPIVDSVDEPEPIARDDLDDDEEMLEPLDSVEDDVERYDDGTANAEDLEELESDESDEEPVTPDELPVARHASTTFGAGLFGFGRGTEVRLPRFAEQAPAAVTGDQEPAVPQSIESESGPEDDSWDESIGDLDELEPVASKRPQRGGRGDSGLVRIAHDRSVATADYEIAEVADVLGRLHISKSILLEEDGVFQIDRSAYQAPVAGKDQDVHSLIRDVTGSQETEDTPGIEELFGGSSGDELSEFASDERPQDDSEDRVGVSVFRFTDQGFDYDGFLRGYKRNDSGLLKSMVSFTRYWHARVGIIFQPRETEHEPYAAIGIDDLCRSSMVISKSSSVARNILNPGRVLFIKRPLTEVEYFKDLCSPQSLAFFERSLFLPLVLGGQRAYFLLGLRGSVDSLEDAFRGILPFMESQQTPVGSSV